jgi:hypothetical protein
VDHIIRDHRSDARSQVSGPAIALMVVGILPLVMSAAGVAFWVFMLAEGSFAEPEDAIINLLSLVAGMIWGGLITFGAVKMKKLTSFRLAMMASIVAMLPCNSCCVLGLPFGIWSLVVLNRPEVKAAFR